MYQVRCFPCQYNEVDSYHKKDHHKHNGTHHHSGKIQIGNILKKFYELPLICLLPYKSYPDFHSHPIHFDGKHLRTCMVCGEVMSTEEEGEIHQSCHDVDVMCV